MREKGGRCSSYDDKMEDKVEGEATWYDVHFDQGWGLLGYRMVGDNISFLRQVESPI